MQHDNGKQAGRLSVYLLGAVLRACSLLIIGSAFFLLPLEQLGSTPVPQHVCLVAGARITSGVLQEDGGAQTKSTPAAADRVSSHPPLSPDWNKRNRGHRETTEAELLRTAIGGGAIEIYNFHVPGSTPTNTKHREVTTALGREPHLPEYSTFGIGRLSDSPSTTEQSPGLPRLGTHSRRDWSQPGFDSATSSILVQVTLTHDDPTREFAESPIESLLASLDMAGEAPVAGREGRSERPGRVVESSVQQNMDGQGALENPENTTGVPVSADRAETTHHPVGRKNRKPVFSAPRESTTTSGKERRGEPHSSPVSGEVSAALPETLQKRLDSAQENGSDVEKATVKDLNRLVSRALEQQVSLDKEWTRYESVEVERLRLLDNRGDSRLLVDTHRHNLREARAEFYTHWNHLDQAAYLLQLQLSNMDIGRLHARTTIGALTPAQQGNGASESVSTGFVGERNAGDDRKAAVEGRTLGVRIDGEMQGDAAVTGGKAWMTFVHPTELLVFASRVQQLLTEQAHLTEFLQSLTVLQNHRLVQLQKMASDQPPRQGKKEPGSLRPSHIKKSRPQRVPRRTSARGQFAPADTLDTEPWHANTDVATLGGSIVFSAAKLGTDPHVHSFPLQRPAVEAAPAHSLHDGAAKEPTTSQPQSRQPKKGKRAVVGGFEVHDDPQETVTSALLRFLSNTLTPADVNGLVPGAAGRRTQGVGGLAEATGRGRMERITDSTVFADRTLNEVLEDEMRKRAFRPAPEHQGENWGSTRLRHKHGSPEEIASSAVLVAVQFADHAAALSVYYDRVEHEGEAKAKMKPEVGVPQEIVFQYAFDNVPLEHKRYLWKEYLQIQLDDRGYEIILPEEPPQEHGDAAETKGPSDFDAGRAHRFDEPPSDEVNFSREDSKTHESLSLSEADETTPPGENVTEDVDAHPRLMLNELLQRLMDEDRENGTRQENSHGIRALKMELPGSSAEELGNLAGIGGEEGSLFPYVKDELDSKSKLADFLIAHAGLGGGDRSLFREQSWKSEDSLHYDDSELDTLRDENGDDDAVFDWLWDLDFIVI